MIRCFLLVVVVVVLFTLGSLGAQEKEWSGQIDQLFEKWNQPRSPGCAVGIVRRGELIYSKGFGSANLEYEVANTPRTVFETASFSKAVTCLCLALLLDEGKLAPDDELHKFIPEMHAFDSQIRIQDMVRCRTGLWDQISVPILIGWENAPLQTPHTDADFFSLLSGQKRLPFKPGSEFRYSSGDYFLLSLIVQRASGQSLAEFAKQRVFQPLGMKRTFFEVDPTQIVNQRAVGHYKPQGEEWHLWRPAATWSGGGGLMTCVEDLHRWDQDFAKTRLTRGKYLDAFLQDGELLGNRSCLDVDAYLKETDPEARRSSPPGQYRGLRQRQYTGGAWGFSSAMTQFPEQELTLICLSNCGEIPAWTMNRRMADVLLADELQPKPPSTPSVPASDQPAVELSEVELREKVGAYRLKQTGQIWRITLEGGELKLIDHLRAAHRLRPLSPTRLDPEGSFFYPTTQFVFSRKTPDAPLSFVSQWDEPENRGTLDFQPVDLVEPTPEQLAQYTGEYVSDELAATYRLTLRDDQLWLRINSRRWERLDATVRDEFIPHLRQGFDGRILRFLRNQEGAVTGLAADYYRVTDVRFARR